MKDRKNILKKSAVAALVTVLVLLFVCLGKTVSCDRKPVPGPTESNDLIAGVPGNLSKGIHEVSVKDSDIKFIEDGKSDYKIVIPKDCDPMLYEAANELNILIDESADVILDVVDDNVAGWDGGSKYIVLGKDNALFAAAGIEVPVSVLGERGAFVRTAGNSVFIAGRTPEGTLNGVYEWLHYQLNFEPYGSEEMVLLRDVEDLSLKDIELTEVPDIEFIASTYGWTDNDAKVMRRMRYTSSFWIPLDNTGWIYHNSFGYIDPEIYRDGVGHHDLYHPEWFSDDGLNLCYTAHGNEESVKQMTDVAGEVLKKALKKNPGLSHITFSQQDATSWCTCDACSALCKKYGTNAVGPIRFCNGLDEYIRAWFDTPEGAPYRRDLKIAFFAYHATEQAPVRYDADKDRYSPADDSVRLNDNVGIVYAPIRASYQLPLNDSYNRKYYENIRAWASVCRNIYMWTYSTNFHYYLVPTNTYNSMQFNYRFLSECGTGWYVDQAAYNQIVSGFSALKLYLNSKLAWNADSDFSLLTDNFFRNYFGPAAKPMRKYFDELRTHWEYIEDRKNYIGDTFLEPLKTEYWQKSLLERWINYTDAAASALEPLKESDPGAYKMYADNVLLESISPRYLLIELYGQLLDNVELQNMKNAFRDDCTKLNVTSLNERTGISELWSKWGI